MTEIYGHKWTSAYGDEAGPEGAAGTWAKGLAGVTVEQVAEGITACLVSADPWPPTLPEFRAMCLGIPTFAAVSADKAKVSGFTRLVWQNMDGHNYSLASTDKAEKMLRAAYEIAREHVMKGGDLPPPAVAELPRAHPVNYTPPTKTEMADILERARRAAGLK